MLSVIPKQVSAMAVFRLNELLTLDHLASLSFYFTTFDLLLWKIHTDVHGSCSKAELSSSAIHFLSTGETGKQKES